MRLRDLEVVWAIASSRSMREAARRLGVTQPAVSQALRRAEDLIGVQLFTRQGRALVPAPELRALMPEFERIFAGVEEVRARSAQMGRGQSGALAVATIPTLAGPWFAEAAQLFRRRFPRMTLRVMSVPTGVVIERVRSGAADLGLLHGPFAAEGLQATKLGDNRVIALVPQGHPLAGRASVGPRELRNHELVVIGPGTPPGDLIAAAFARANVPYSPAVEVTTSATAVLLVQAGVGVALVDANVTRPGCPAGTEAIGFSPRIALNIEAALPAARPLSPPAVAFVALLRRAAARRA
jgi:DNA-binding transcriptional LysR family regulator